MKHSSVGPPRAITTMTLGTAQTEPCPALQQVKSDTKQV